MKSRAGLAGCVLVWLIALVPGAVRAQTNGEGYPRALPVAVPVSPPVTDTNSPPPPSPEELALWGEVRAGYWDPAVTAQYNDTPSWTNLIAANPAGFEIATASWAVPGPSTNRVLHAVEIVEERYLYARVLTGAGSNEVLALGAALRQASTGWVAGVVLDLRDWDERRGLDDAAAVASWFAPEGRILYSVGRRGESPVPVVATGSNAWRTVPLTVVVNAGTSGAGEALAAALQDTGRAIVVGARTAGRGGLFREWAFPGGSNWLRMATHAAFRADGSALVGDGVVPDLVVTVEPAAEARMLRLQESAGVGRWVNDAPGRPLQSEAALVRGENPGVDVWRERLDGMRSGKRPRNDEVPTRDVALQRAFDLFRALDALDLLPRDIRARRPAPATNAPAARRPQAGVDGG